MADSGLFIGYGQPVRGRERKAIQIFGEAVAYYTGLQERGEVESFEVAFLEPHGGDLGGFFLLRGEREKIAQLRVSDEFTELSRRAMLVVENYGVVRMDLGDRIAEQMARYQEAVGELA